MKRVFVSLFLSALLGAIMAQAADLPVKQVILYKHGIGFFERSGTLGPGESARLDFNSSDMNDVLKSLTLEERGGGKISGLRYDSMDPLSHRLADFPFQIGDDQSLAAIFGRLQGARVELKFGNDTVAGAIVGGRVVAGTDKQAEREFVTLLLDSGDIRTLDLAAASGIRFTDANLQANFKDYLTAVAAARSKDKRSVYIDSTDARQREIIASYTIPAAVWKSSYRLILGDKGQPTLEGWAIVDNTTGEDWNKVQLSLVSGRPISFISQLYAPKYVQRPSAELADDNAARPVVHDEAFTVNGTGSGGGIGAGRGGAGRAVGGVFGGIIGAPAPPPPAQMAVMMGRNDQMEQAKVAPSTIVASASAGELGELFEYRIAQPVTIRKDESAMLPFLQQAIEGRKLLIYSDHSSQHPTNAAELTNSSGKTLDGGPITVYDGGAYGGEALMETLKAGDKRLISYAVDLGTRITDAFNSKAAVIREVHATRGVITTKSAMEETRTYTIRNVDQKAKTLILEHPLRQGYTLLNAKPAEKTASAYRFEIQLAAGATQEFPVTEENVFNQSYQVSNMGSDFILAYVQNRNLTLSDAARRQLQRIADEKSQIAENDRALQDAQNQVNDLTRDEDRIRQNINSLNSVSSQQQLVQNYAKQLDAHEQQLAQLRDHQSDLQKKKAALQSDLDKLIEALAF
jgi:chaperonin cofactor prefoldin